MGQLNPRITLPLIYADRQRTFLITFIKVFRRRFYIDAVADDTDFDRRTLPVRSARLRV